MKNWSVRQRIAWSFGAVIALMILMGAFAFTRLATIEQETSDLQKDSVPGLYYSDQLMTDWLNNYSLTQRHVLATDRGESKKWKRCSRPSAPGWRIRSRTTRRQ